MSDLHLPGLTRRAAEAMKPFVDEALELEREGLLNDRPTKALGGLFAVSDWVELLAALRESQREAEGITGGV